MFLGFGAFIFKITHLQEKHYTKYSKLFETSVVSHKSAMLSYIQNLRQTRKNVSKHLYLEQKSFQNITIQCQDSLLFCFNRKNHIEIVEQMEKVCCIIQEKFQNKNGEPFQKIKYIEAENACLNYHTKLFIGHQVTIKQYELPGDTLYPSYEHFTPVLSSQAETIELTYTDKDVQIKAQCLKSTMDTTLKTL